MAKHNVPPLVPENQREKHEVWIGDYPACDSMTAWEADHAAERINAAIEKWRPTEQAQWLVVLDALLSSGGNCTPAVVALANALGLKVDWADVVREVSDDQIATEFYRRGLEQKGDPRFKLPAGTWERWN